MTESRQSNVLREAYGNEVILLDENEESVAYSILKEFHYDGRLYAVIQTAEQSKQDEIEIYRVINNQDAIELETIEDDDEFEAVAEIYDDMVFDDETGRTS